MKLHNLLLTAALFISTAAAFAAPIEPTSFKASDKNTGYYIAVPKYQEGSYGINLTFTRYNSAEGEWGYSLFAYEANEASADWTLDLTRANASAILDEHEIEVDGKTETMHKYFFNIPIEYDKEGNPNITKIGILARREANSTTNIPIKNGHFYFYEVEIDDTEHFVFGKNGEENIKAEFAFGTPLPTPVVTLLIALGFGAALVIYRSRKQVKA